MKTKLTFIHGVVLGALVVLAGNLGTHSAGPSLAQQLDKCYNRDHGFAHFRISHFFTEDEIVCLRPKV